MAELQNEIFADAMATGIVNLEKRKQQFNQESIAFLTTISLGYLALYKW